MRRLVLIPPVEAELDAENDQFQDEIVLQAVLAAFLEQDELSALAKLNELPYTDSRFEELSLAAYNCAPGIFSGTLEWGARNNGHIAPSHAMKLVTGACVDDNLQALSTLSNLARPALEIVKRWRDPRPIITAVTFKSHDVYHWLAEEGFGFAQLSCFNLGRLAEIARRNDDQFYLRRIARILNLALSQDSP